VNDVHAVRGELGIVSGEVGESSAHGHDGHNLYLHMHTINEETKKGGGTFGPPRKSSLARVCVLTDEFSLSSAMSLIMCAIKWYQRG
jgi:hypothetical protein